METLHAKVLPHEREQVMVNSFVQSVYSWMTIGLGLTAVVAFLTANSPLRLVVINPLVFGILSLGELGLVFWLSGRISHLTASAATTMFLVYAALNGLTLSSIFLYADMGEIGSAFLTCCLTFGACSVYGYTTQKDLTSVGSFMFMGLIGIIIASVINLFLQSHAMTMVISYIGVLVFVGLTAYDTQKIKEMAMTQPADLDAGVVRKGAIMGALSLYLDFINLFIMLVRIMAGGDD